MYRNLRSSAPLFVGRRSIDDIIVLTYLKSSIPFHQICKFSSKFFSLDCSTPHRKELDLTHHGRGSIPRRAHQSRPKSDEETHKSRFESEEKSHVKEKSPTEKESLLGESLRKKRERDEDDSQKHRRERETDRRASGRHGDRSSREEYRWSTIENK